MKYLLQFVLTLFTLSHLSSAAPLNSRQQDNASSIPPPAQDPWYMDEPPRLTAYPPGAVIDHRAVPVPAYFNTGLWAGRVGHAWQVKYRTTDSRYRPTWAVTTLFAPAGRHDARSTVLLSVQQPYDSANVSRSASYVALTTTDNAQYTYALPAIFGSQPAWFVNMPDYEGPRASFASGAVSGMATLDSVRAVSQLGRLTGMGPDVPFIMWGYSGGALATEWAAELQGSYAPELTGRALWSLVGGLTPNLTEVFYTITDKNTSSAFLIPEAIEGIASQFPELQPEIVSATGKGSWKAVVDGVRKMIAATDLSSLRRFVDALVSIDDVGYVLMEDGVMGVHGVPQMDMYVYHTAYDQISPVASTRKLVDRICGLGGKVQYKEYTTPGLDHVGMGMQGFLDAFDLLDKIAKGKKLSECVKSTISQ